MFILNDLVWENGRVFFNVTSFAGAMQLNIKRVRKAGEGEYDPADYLPVSENSTDDMYTQLVAMIGTVKNTYLNTLFEETVYRG